MSVSKLAASGRTAIANMLEVLDHILAACRNCNFVSVDQTRECKDKVQRARDLLGIQDETLVSIMQESKNKSHGRAKRQ